MYDTEPIRDSDSAQALIDGWSQPIAAVLHNGRPIAIVPEPIAMPLEEMLNAALILRDP